VKTIEDFFPNLAADVYKITSNQTIDYNCIAWAAGDNANWWDISPGYYWPKDAARTQEIGTLVDVFESLGYEVSDNEDLEEGFEKVALYGDLNGFTHAARQLPGGSWTSKLGPLEDIEHQTTEGITGAYYGTVFKLMKRSKGK
jgi:hypothetical protein